MQSATSGSALAIPVGIAGDNGLERDAVRAVRTPRRPQAIGVLSLDRSPHGRATAFCGVERAVRGTDYAASVVSVPTDDRDSLAKAVAQLRQLPIDGLLAVASRREAIDALAEIAADLPLVVIGAEGHPGVSLVSVDHYAGALAATRHLLDLGHSTVFHIAGPAERPDARLRQAGWRDALTIAGLTAPAPIAGDWSAECGYELGRELAAEDQLTAVFAANDQMALGLLRALREAGRRVPQDVSVVGFDDIPDGEFLRPPLTTVRHDCTELGRRAFEVLRSEIAHGRQITTDTTLAAELVVRASTALAPSQSL